MTTIVRPHGESVDKTLRVVETTRHPGLTATLATSVLLAVMVVESTLGLVVSGLYDEEPWAVAALRGNDLVTLVLVVPLLVMAVVRSRSSTRWQAVWLAGLLYGVYNFTYYAFGTNFNDVFLLHVASLTLSVLGAITVASSIDADDLSCVSTPPTDRIVAAYMLFVGGALVLAWGALSLRFAVTGELPEDVMPPTAVHLVYAIDLSLLAPAFLAGGVLLWRHRPWGVVLGIAVNLAGAAYLTVLEFVSGFQAEAGIAGKTWLSTPTIAGALLCATAGLMMLRRRP